uniref:Uncharacterized protein n=1 Tax=Oryza brachyantha TaxID=4533 RepID=J3NAF5_ORYBR
MAAYVLPTSGPGKASDPYVSEKKLAREELARDGELACMRQIKGEIVMGWHRVAA